MILLITIHAGFHSPNCYFYIDTAKDAAFQQEAQPGYYKRMPSNQPEQPHQVPVRHMMPSQQARVSPPPMQHQSIQINQAMQHQHLLPLNHPAQFQPLPFRQPIQHQQLPLNQQIEHRQSLRQGLQEASYQGEYQMPQFIHCEPEIRSEPVLGKRALPSRSGGPLGRDGNDLACIHLLIIETSTEVFLTI